MPRGDGTGPLGQGPMTGRGAGYCVGFQAAGNIKPVLGRGFGMGRGRGGRRGFKYSFYGPYVQKMDMNNNFINNDIAIKYKRKEV